MIYEEISLLLERLDSVTAAQVVADLPYIMQLAIYLYNQSYFLLPSGLAATTNTVDSEAAKTFFPFVCLKHFPNGTENVQVQN